MNSTWRTAPREHEKNDWVVMAMMIRAMQREGKCRVHWGGHSCDEERLHGGEHKCTCGVEPYGYSVMWGDDLSDQEIAEMPARCRGLGFHEGLLKREESAIRNGHRRKENSVKYLRKKNKKAVQKMSREVQEG